MHIIIPLPHILQILIRNKLREGMSRAEVAALLRKRLHWDSLEPDKMNAFGRERYRLAKEIIDQLER